LIEGGLKVSGPIVTVRSTMRDIALPCFAKRRARVGRTRVLGWVAELQLE
jgi:hypothetical protein